MKWIYAFFLYSFFFIFSLKAQKKFDIQLGLSGGYTFNSVGIDGRNVFNTRGIRQFFLESPHGNISLYIHKVEKKVGLISELGYTTKGWVEARYGGQYITKLNYLQLSLMSNIWVKTFSFKNSFFRPVILAGVYGSRLLDYSDTFIDGIPTPEGTEEEFVFPRYKFNDSSNEYDYGLIIGAGIEYERKKYKIFTDIRYYYGFLPILNKDDPGNPGFIQNNQVRLTIGIFYVF